ncbi:hypothetical protein [Echinimonas agarilytica]|uniref:Uncharacterized protein n=1 Tax=Echinimonas agarilytica TaxID=1215918 RepID=A0AA41W8N4_9GAMM|nr:hypothetical protein [Echinimonas agarilytica]MCM2680522.1 hypothetical protein [Echinimonas agarilytica]
MNDETQINIDLFKTHVEKFLKGREIKWKLVVSFWAAIGAITSLLFGEYFPSPREIWIISIAVSLLFALWIFPVSFSIKKDRALYSKYRNNLEIVARESSKAEEYDVSYWPGVRDVGDLLITFLIVLGCCYLLASAPKVSQLTSQCSSQPLATGTQ